MNDILIAPILGEEVKIIMFQSDATKSPSPNVPSCFLFKDILEHVGSVVVTATLDSIFALILTNANTSCSSMWEGAIGAVIWNENGSFVVVTAKRCYIQETLLTMEAMPKAFIYFYSRSYDYK